MVVPSSVRAELERLVGEEVPHAALARAFAARLRTIPTTLRGDAAVLDVAIRTGAPVLTSDRVLAERIASVGGSVLVPRDRSRLELRRGSRRESPPTRPASRRRPNR